MREQSRTVSFPESMSSATASPRVSRSIIMPQGLSLKRRRVTRACQRCRALKSKCDGRHPVCSRCQGYGYACVWSDSENNPSRSRDTSRVDSPGATISDEQRRSSSTEDSTQLHQAIQSYEKLIASLRLDLKDPSRAAVDLTLAHIRNQLPEDVTSAMEPESNLVTTAPPGLPSRDGSSEQTPRQTPKRHRYLGEASDVHFFHVVKQVLGDKQLSGNAAEHDIQSYDQEELSFQTPNGHAGRLHLPSREVAEKYIDIYFCTIHIAYPFISKSSFMARYENFRNGDFEVGKSSSWLPLLYTIFAIGAYYFSFPHSENAESPTHLQYFEQAFSLGSSVMTDCSLDNIHMLLAQCFFLLATGQSDRCWNILGLAVRVGQTIGLHVEDSLKRSVTSLSLLEQETMRRTWYSMYVLDRLLALQLGRPVAIHEDEYSMNLPSKAELPEETAGDMNRGDPANQLGDGLSALDYFHSVVKFSRIVGQVISDLYRPSQLRMDPDQMLLSTTTLDEKLLEWKLDLPRHLRFDLGHTFEQSLVFRRQRNMLAIKFHHLRALIHRPYLCLTYLQQNNRPLVALLDRAREHVDRLERTCVLEARQTAQLLYHVADEKGLVYEYPWWQMISCLLCASSILLVASAYFEPDQATTELQPHALHEDAETCLKVFDALSANSGAARLARDMMRGLKEMHIVPRDRLGRRASSAAKGDQVIQAPATVPAGYVPENVFDESLNMGMASDLFSWQSWPGELSDSMMWSAQFLDPAYNLQYHGALFNPDDMGQDRRRG